MRFSSISINLLEFFRIQSFDFDLKYLSQNSINFNMFGVFWNPQDEQIQQKNSKDHPLQQQVQSVNQDQEGSLSLCRFTYHVGIIIFK